VYVVLIVVLAYEVVRERGRRTYKCSGGAIDVVAQIDNEGGLEDPNQWEGWCY
jgi:hypothetical protein